MIKLNKESKIYILCPAAIETGGPESVHLLCEKLLERGFYCNIVYLAHSYPGGAGHPGHGPIDRSDQWQNYIVTDNCKPKSYEVYKTKCIDRIEDDSNNLLITLEIFTFTSVYFKLIGYLVAFRTSHIIYFYFHLFLLF